MELELQFFPVIRARMNSTAVSARVTTGKRKAVCRAAEWASAVGPSQAPMMMPMICWVGRRPHQNKKIQRGQCRAHDAHREHGANDRVDHHPAGDGQADGKKNSSSSAWGRSSTQPRKPVMSSKRASWPASRVFL